VIRIVPGMAEGYYGLGVALGQLGRFREAVAQYEQALRIEPRYARAQNNLAWLLATLPTTEGGDPARAVTLAQSACERIGTERADAVDTLAVAYAAQGRFNDAIAASEKAMELALESGRSELAKEIAGRVELYRLGRAYRLSVHESTP
jgi:tetratricopeptide (TPR) repeat protein